MTADEFAALVEPHRRELQVHCYRMLASYDESEDLVQETFLRAWRGRHTFEGRSTLRAWLYRIATNACLDFLERHPREPKPYATPATVEPSVEASPPVQIPWLQPYPDSMLDPEASAEAREAMELVYLVAIQHLPGRQRAALILRDVIGWSAKETGEALDMSVAAVKSALQRARPVLKEHLPEERTEWSRGADPTEQQQELLRRYIEASERGDSETWAELVTEDLRLTMPPAPMWFAGRDSIKAFVAQSTDQASPTYFGEFKGVPTRANGQPAAAVYVRRPGTTKHRAQVLDVLRIENGKVAEVTAFEPHLFPTFGLPMTI